MNEEAMIYLAICPNMRDCVKIGYHSDTILALHRRYQTYYGTHVILHYFFVAKERRKKIESYLLTKLEAKDLKVSREIFRDRKTCIEEFAEASFLYSKKPYQTFDKVSAEREKREQIKEEKNNETNKKASSTYNGCEQTDFFLIKDVLENEARASIVRCLPNSEYSNMEMLTCNENMVQNELQGDLVIASDFAQFFGHSTDCAGLLKAHHRESSTAVHDGNIWSPQLHERCF